MIYLTLFLISLGVLNTQTKTVESYGYTGQTIWDFEAVPEEKLDIGLWSLIFAKEIDPSVDIVKNLEKLDEMKTEVHKMIAGRQIDILQFSMIRTYLYEKGLWNDLKPYLYDLDDPTGRDVRTKFLPKYLKTKRGNCVSMPTLFLSLAERVNPKLDIHGVHVPRHIFVRFTDRQTNDVWNVETTNKGAPMRNVFVIQQNKVPQKAIDKGAYMRALSKKEYLTVLLNEVARFYRVNEDFEKALKIIEMGLRVNPNTITLSIQKGGTLFEYIDYIKKHDKNLTDEKMFYINRMNKMAWDAINYAKSLGWVKLENDDKEYSKIINEEKEKRKKG